eukprot:scaffold1355_cov268-Pinguiococcus_pyrenoidosus.AAC.54
MLKFERSRRANRPGAGSESTDAFEERGFASQVPYVKPSSRTPTQKGLSGLLRRSTNLVAIPDTQELWSAACRSIWAMCFATARSFSASSYAAASSGVHSHPESKGPAARCTPLKVSTTGRIPKLPHGTPDWELEIFQHRAPHREVLQLQIAAPQSDAHGLLAHAMEVRLEVLGHRAGQIVSQIRRHPKRGASCGCGSPSSPALPPLIDSLIASSASRCPSASSVAQQRRKRSCGARTELSTIPRVPTRALPGAPSATGPERSPSGSTLPLLRHVKAVRAECNCQRSKPRQSQPALRASICCYSTGAETR